MIGLTSVASAQTLKPASCRNTAEERGTSGSQKGQKRRSRAADDAMSIAEGTPIKVALDSEVRVREVVRPFMQDDRAHLCVRQAADSRRNRGKRKVWRSMAYRRWCEPCRANGNFSPVRRCTCSLTNGEWLMDERIALQYGRYPAPDGVLQFVSEMMPQEKQSAGSGVEQSESDAAKPFISSE